MTSNKALADKSTRGVALINAVVVVAMIAVFSALLISRGYSGAHRLSASHQSSQLSLFLDAAALLAPEVLTDTIGSQEGFSVHSEAYGKVYDVPILDGRVIGQVTDLQSRFNLAWLINPNDLAAQDAFARLWEALDLPEGGREHFIQGLRDHSVNDSSGTEIKLGQWVGLHGAALRQAGLSVEQRVLLASHVAHLSDDARLNINMAPIHVLGAFLPGLEPDALESVMSARNRAAFANVRELQFRLGAHLPRDRIAQIDFDFLDTRSDWLQVDLTAERDGKIATSQIIVRRRGAVFERISTVSP